MSASATSLSESCQSASHPVSPFAVDKADPKSGRAASAPKATFAAKLPALVGCRKRFLRWVDGFLARGTKRANAYPAQGLVCAS